MRTWFTSDTHFNHVNIINLCKRPFETIEEMNAIMIANWNLTVKPEDTIYHIGDFAMGDRSLIPDIIKQLNGTIVLLKGNHDLRNSGDVNKYLAACVSSIYDSTIIRIEDKLLYMTHIPNFEFKSIDPDIDYHICGHVHESWTRQGNILNAGVDVHGFKPVSLQTLIDMPEIKGESHRGY